MFLSKAEGLHVALKQLAVDVLCGDIGWVGLACDLGQREVSGPESFLDPEISSSQMLNLSQHVPFTDVNGSCGMFGGQD